MDRAAVALVASALCCWTVLLSGGFLGAVADLDIWHEMALIREALREGGFPHGNVFSYTPSAGTFVVHEWGSGLIVYTVTAVFGGSGLLFLNSVVALVVIFISVRAAMVRGATVGAACSISLIALPTLATAFSPFRAESFSHLFTATLLYFLGRDRLGDRRWIWAWIPAFAVWSNLHGGCVIGLAVLATELLERAVKRLRYGHLVAVWAANFAALSCTPDGFTYYRYLASTLLLDRPEITEWHPIWYAPTSGIVTVSIVLLSALAIYSAVKDRSITTMMLLLAGLMRMKMLPFVAVSAVALGAPVLRGSRISTWVQKRRELRLGASFGFCCMALLLLAANLPNPGLLIPGQPHGRLGLAYPVGAVQYLRQAGFRGNLLTPFDSGAYVTWHLFPSVRVGMDARYDVGYPVELVHKVFAFYYQDPPTSLQELPIYPHTDAALIPNRSPAIETIRAGWNLVYKDRGFSIYAKPGIALPVVDRTGTEFWGELPPSFLPRRHSSQLTPTNAEHR